ncbi:MAG: VWA domain-containing protein [Myxococcales bacterium]
MLEPCLVETDAYDREAFARALRQVDGAEELVEHGERLLPHFRPLLEDLFAALFKLVVRVRAEADAPASTGLNRRLLTAMTSSPDFGALKEETSLDAARAAHAAARLARRALALVKGGDLLLEEELLQAQELAGEEERAARLREAAQDLKDQASPETAKELEDQADQAERRVRSLARKVAQSNAELPQRFDADLSQAASRLAEDLPRLDESVDSFSRSVGASGPRSAGERLKLAEKLEQSEKLRALAALAGAFRADARAVRRKNRERAATEVYRVGSGAEIGRLLPSELVALRHPLRRRDFLRRLIEEQLSQYDLRGDDRHGRGPVVVCVDGSGSMAGPRELWAKAVSLALLDVARRQGRRAKAIVFSGPEAPLAEFDLTRSGKLGSRRTVALDSVVRLAECFPGGGTDFEKPLRAALEAVKTHELAGADVVFITDGEASLSDAFAEEVRQEKKKRDLAIFAVLVDDPASSRNVVRGEDALSRAAKELGKVADELTTVTELTSEAAKDLFRRL